MLPEYYEFCNTVKILSGSRSLENIPYELKTLEVKKPIILTQKILLDNGLVNVVIDALDNSKIKIGPIFFDIPPESSFETVNEITRLYNKKNCDSIIAIGGGSVIDTAKAVNIMVSKKTENLMDFLGSEIITGNFKPLIIVPTTAGTGSEATNAAVISHKEKGLKLEFHSNKILPNVAIIDPRSTLTLPPIITAATAMDALAHAIEAYTALQKNPISDTYAVSAIKLIGEYLFIVVKDGSDENARVAMANAALLAGIAFSNSMVGIVHSIGHAIGAVSHVPHANVISIILPYGMEYNLSASKEYFAELLLPLAGPDKYANTPKSLRAKESVKVVRNWQKKLNKMCGLPLRLRDLGVKKEDFDEIIEKAIHDGSTIENRKEVDREIVGKILNKAW